QDIRASVVSTTIGPFQVPVRLRPPASAAVGLLSALQPIVNPSRTTATIAVFLMVPREAKSVPPVGQRPGAVLSFPLGGGLMKKALRLMPLALVAGVLS